MPWTSALIDAYIDANIILLLAFLVWRLVRAVIGRTGFRHEYVLQLRLTEGLMLAAVASPVIAIGLTAINRIFLPETPLNASDFAVAQFLEGRVAMEAERFEALLGLRQSLIEQVAGLETPLARAVALAFGLGVAAYAAMTLRGILGLNRLIRDSFVWRRFGRLDLRLSDAIAVPFSTRGLLRRHIVIPSGMLASPGALRIALAHELQHMRRLDTEWELGLALIRPLFFWNPAYLWWKRDLERLRELSCDQVLLRRRRVSARDYADCLLAVCRQSLGHVGPVNLAVPKVPFLKIGPGGAGRRNLLALRLRMVAISDATPTRRHPEALLWALLTAAALTVSFGASAIGKPGDWSQDRLMLSTIVNLERLETRNTGLSLEGY